MSELTRMTAAELAAAVASGEASAVEVTQAHLDRIAAVDASVRAFLHVDAEGALAAARAVDAARAAGTAARPAGRRAAGDEGRRRHPGSADDGRLEDPRRLAPALRRDDQPADQGRPAS